MTRPLAFCRPGPEGVEVVVVTYAADGAATVHVAPLAPRRAIDLGHDLIGEGLRRLPDS